MIHSVSPKSDVLAITETKLNENSVTNVDISGYNFYHDDSSTNAGGAGLYVKLNLKTIVRPDIKLSLDGVESCWVEIESDNASGNNKRRILGDNLDRANLIILYFS